MKNDVMMMMFVPSFAESGFVIGKHSCYLVYFYSI